MNKQRASGRKDGYACISGLADICESSHYEQCIASQSIRATQRRGTRLKRGGVRMCGAITNHYVVCESSQERSSA